MVLAQLIQTTITEAHQALTLLEMGAQESRLRGENGQNDSSTDKTDEKSKCWTFSTCHKIREHRYETEVYKPFSPNLREDVKEFSEINDCEVQNQTLNQNQENLESFERKHDSVFQTRSVSPDSPSMVAGTVVQTWKTSSLKRPGNLILPGKTGHRSPAEGSTPLESVKTVVHDSTTSIYSDISSPMISEAAAEYYLSDHSQDMLMHIIRCFPFPSPKNSPKVFKRQQSRGSAQNGCDTEPSSSGDLASPTSPAKQKKHLFARHGNAVSNLFHKHLNHEKRKRAESSISENGPGSPTTDTSDGRSYAHSTTSAPGFCANHGGSGSETTSITRGALSTLCQVSVDTMAITALPLDCWLKERLKNWVQLSGHKGTIVPATNQTLWKKLGDNVVEARAYEEITADHMLTGFTPKFYKEIQHKDDSFIEIQDLLADFPNVQTRAVMDIKIGTRTFLESEVANTKKRHDLYNKMIAIDPDEPTEEERAEEAITKLRYMQFRERESSTNTLGFRIEAAQLPGGILQKSFQKVRTHDQVVSTLKTFLGDRFLEVSRQFEARLRAMRDAIEKSHFFRTHEIVGSSILFIYDQEKSGAWMIDFAKATKVDENMTLNHRQTWQVGNREDGYLVGLDNLIQVFAECHSNHS